MATKDLLKEICGRYLKSGDFNGFYFDGQDGTAKSEVIKLIEDGLVQVVSEQDYPNPHIRPWASRRTIEDQVRSIRLLPGAYGVCLYPTPKALKSRRVPTRLADQPFARDMAKGRGTLELAYFQFDVLEGYRNDPRYTFRFYDFGATAVVSDEVYLDENEPERDKIIMAHVGFAYDLPEYDRENPESPIVRRVCAFYGDLAKLSPEHQSRWKTYQVDDDVLEPHPVWWMQQMGHWPDGVGSFEAIFLELQSINELHKRAFGQALFKSTSRPEDFGWILRASQSEFDKFIQDLDKLLSENLRHDAFDAHGVDRKDIQGNNIGSLNRLDRWLESVHVGEQRRRGFLAPFREIRSARQKPAHAIRKNVTNRSFVHKQADLLEQVSDSLASLRRFLSGHPANKTWTAAVDTDGKRYRL